MKWVLLQPDAQSVARLAGETGVSPVIAMLLVNRGVDDTAEARSFLSSDLSDLSSPGVFLHMDSAVKRIKEAVSRRETITIFGDYDVDGVTGSALLYLVLREMGAETRCYLPDRMTEGYGLNPAALGRIKDAGGGLVISVDCGISATKAAAHARALGLDLIITDHHELAAGAYSGDLASGLPEACAIIHPALLDPSLSGSERERISVITGVGVAFKLAQALLGPDAGAERLAPYLDLVTLGTIADVGRIIGENRILVRHGLRQLSAQDRQRPGIEALKQVAGLNGKTVTTGTVGFTIAPRINASGRMERADAAFRLLTTESRDEALRIAQDLELVNRERQRVEERILDDARSRCREHGTGTSGALVLASGEWHPGVIGIVASRIADEFYRPAALISLKDGIGKGSARSIPGFDLYAGLKECADLLTGFGGHTCAAGFTISEERIPAFRERLGALVRERMGPEGFVKKLTVDGPVKLEDLTLPLMRDLERLAPFGHGNPEPRLGARSLTVLTTRIVGNNHLKMRLRQEKGMAFDAIAFNRGDALAETVRDGNRIAAIFTPRLNCWNGNTRIELEVKDVKPER